MRSALRHLGQPEQLCDEPLARAPLVTRWGPSPGSLEAADTLKAVVLRAIDTLDGRDRHAELLRRTYVEPASKQLAVADEVSMAFSTYRRHLKTATDRLVERLWAWETTGLRPRDD